MSRRIAPLIGAGIACILLLSGCAAEPNENGTGDGPPASTAPSQPAASTPPSETASPPTSASATPEPPVAAPVTQAETCDWDGDVIEDGSADARPSAPGADLASAIVGAWQHTHIDRGSGFEPMGEGIDIRYVFPSSSRLLYCQDVAYATSQAENATDMQLDGTEIVLPAPSSGYAVTAWDDHTMVLKNHYDGSMYLLKRR